MAGSFAEEEGTVLLFSGGSFASSSSSYLALFPEKKILIPYDIQDNPWDLLKSEAAEGYWMGYLCYEMGFHALPFRGLMPLERKPQPIAAFVKPRYVLRVDHESDRATVCFEMLSGEERGRIEEALKNKDKRRDRAACNLDVVQSLKTPEEYRRKIETAMEWIRNGDVYQVNLSHGVRLEGVIDAFSLFLALTEVNPQPFSAYLNIEGRRLVSLSPERFLRITDRLVEAMPIKGTAKRGRNALQDQAHYEDLMHSEKEAAELLMITDLMRNDLGKICKPGSVTVPHLKVCEKYSYVYHTHSVIQGELKDEISAWDSLRACFPAGSITGCPKMKAMELIEILDDFRGIYTGAIGFVKDGSACDFNVAIRTVDIVRERIEVFFGGGITAGSDPRLEYEETASKGTPFLDILVPKP